MLTRKAKRLISDLEQHRAERHERIGRQMPPPTLHRAAMGGTTQAAEPPKPAPKLARRQKVRQDVRASAKGEECTVRLLGVCNHNPETTVWSHYPRNAAGKGMGTKSLDLAGCYCCSACHDVVDGRVPMPAGLSNRFMMLAWFEGHMRSLVRLAEKGLL